MNIASLFARIGIKADSAQAKNFHSTMKGLKGALIATTAAAGGISLAIKKITSDALNGAVAFKQFETETGASAQELQKWQAVAQQTNMSAESVTSAIKSIADNQAKIRLGQGNISGYQLLGIDPRQDPFKILEELREKTQGLSDNQKKNVLSMMGISAQMLQTLNLSRDQFDALAENAFIISPQAIETLNKTKSALDLAGRAVKWLKAEITIGLGPQIKEITKKFVEFVKVNRDGIVAGFQKALKIVNALVSGISALIFGTDKLSKSMRILVGVLAGIAFIMAANPITLITAGIILLIGLIQDIYVYTKGGKSIFGMMVEGIKNSKIVEWIEKFIENIKEVYRTLVEVFEKIRNFMKETGENITIGTKAQQEAGFGGSYAEGVRRYMGGNTTVNNDVDINNYGTTDPRRIKQQVQEAMQKGWNSTSAQRGNSE
jgi:hypothetical protein